jgi:phosphoglycolate phosphatase
MIRRVVFDFDGTLVDSNAVKREAYDRIVAAHPDGAATIARAIAEAPGDRHSVFARYAELQAAAGFVSPEAGLLARLYAGTVDAAVAAAPEKPHARKLLEALLRSQVPSHVSSATPLSSLRWIVERRGWTGCFQSLHGRPSTKVQTLAHLMEKHGVPADAIAVVGDGEDDAASAAAHGCRFFAVGAARGARVYELPELIPLLAASA